MLTKYIKMMKKIFTICICIMMTTLSLFAQDIIVTKDAKKIDAKILEVSKTEIKYKELDNLEGPTFIAEMSDISSIIYANGKVFIPESSQKSQDTISIATTNIDLQNNIENNSSEIDKIDGYTYSSENGEIKLKYDFKNKKVYIQSPKPLTFHNYNTRNIAMVHFHFSKTVKYLIFDMANKVEGVAILSGLASFTANIGFHTYFKKNMPTSFVIDVPYETGQVSYIMKSAN